jgi:Lrp/AsnC family transcriptional regulator, leucine-responsive regulatory protein
MAKKKKLFEKIEDFKKELHINSKLELDDKDNKLISLIQDNPQISQEEIAKEVKLSQPSVGARIRKLQQKGVLAQIYGVNFKTVDLHLAKIDIVATDTQGVIDEIKECPFFINALTTSGKYNICLFFMATDLKRLEGIVNYHLRGNSKVKDIVMDVVIKTDRDFVHSMNLKYEKQVCCEQNCRDCI